MLAVEVTSTGSLSTDRIAEPAQYAAAGIPHFWRRELDPLLPVVHRLLIAPVPLSFRLPDLMT